MAKKPELFFHFLPNDGRLQFGEREKVFVGRTLRIKDQPVLCARGFHASRKAIDALKYAPGSLVCRVTLGGEIVEDSDKLAAQERTVIWKADATNVLHEFSCWCAEDALRTAKVDDVRCWAAIETKRKWLRGEATDDELAAARDAAWDAAWAAARAAAWAAARAAAWAAARAAAWDAAWDAARAAAWAAAWAAARDRAAQNDKLTEMLLALEPKRKETAKQALTRCQAHALAGFVLSRLGL